MTRVASCRDAERCLRLAQHIFLAVIGKWHQRWCVSILLACPRETALQRFVHAAEEKLQRAGREGRLSLLVLQVRREVTRLPSRLGEMRDVAFVRVRVRLQ